MSGDTHTLTYTKQHTTHTHTHTQTHTHHLHTHTHTQSQHTPHTHTPHTHAHTHTHTRARAHTRTTVLFNRQFSEVFWFSSCIFLCQLFQLSSSSPVTTLHTVHHEFVLCSLMWTLIYIQWVTFLYKFIHSFIHSFIILSDDRSKASSKTMPPYSAI